MAEQEMERDLLECTDEEGNTLLLEIDEYFFYNGEEYAAMHEADSEEREETYVMKVNSFTDEAGEQMEEFVDPAPELLETLLAIANTRMSGE